MILFVLCYSRITSINTPTICMPAVSALLTNVTARLPQSHDCRCYVSRLILTHPPLRLPKHAHTTLRTLPTCNMSLVSRTLPSPQAGNCMELILLYMQEKTRVDNAGDRALAIPEQTELCLQFLSNSLSTFAFPYGLSRHLDVSNRKCKRNLTAYHTVALLTWQMKSFFGWKTT